MDGKVQTTVKAAVFSSLSLDSISHSKKLEIPLYIVWQTKQLIMKSLFYCTMHINQRMLPIRTGNMKIFVSIH